MPFRPIRAMVVLLREEFDREVVRRRVVHPSATQGAPDDRHDHALDPYQGAIPVRAREADPVSVFVYITPCPLVHLARVKWPHRLLSVGLSKVSRVSIVPIDVVSAGAHERAVADERSSRTERIVLHLQRGERVRLEVVQRVPVQVAINRERVVLHFVSDDHVRRGDDCELHCGDSGRACWSCAGHAAAQETAGHLRKENCLFRTNTDMCFHYGVDRYNTKDFFFS